MNLPTHTDTQSQLMTQTGKSFFRRILSLRVIGRVACVIFTLLTLIILFYVEEKARGYWAWKQYENYLSTQGIILDIKSLAPKTVSEAKNLAQAPLFKPLYTYASQQKISDPIAYEKFNSLLDSVEKSAKQRGLDLRNFPFSRGNGEIPDLLKMVVKSNKMTIKPSIIPTSNEQVAAMLIDIYKQTIGPNLDELYTEAQVRTQCSFDIPVEKGQPFGLIQPHLYPLKSIAWQYIHRATASLYLNQADNAFRDLQMALRLSDALKNEPFLISSRVSLSIQECAISTLWQGIVMHLWKEPQLEKFQKSLETMDVFPETHKALLSDLIFIDHSIDGFYRLFPHHIDFENLGYAWSDSPYNIYQRGLFDWLYPKGWLYFERFNFHRIYNDYFISGFKSNANEIDVLEFDQKVNRLNEEMKTPSFQRVRNHKILTGILLPNMQNLMGSTVVYQTSINLAVTACALERYRLKNGLYPNTLLDLSPNFIENTPKDILSGKSLIYRMLDRNEYVLYSMGFNKIDDGGKIVIGPSGFMSLTEGDLVWKFPGKN